MERIAAEIEQNLQILGVTAIEDKLQDGVILLAVNASQNLHGSKGDFFSLSVPLTLKLLKRAGIKI
eukprot:1366439-Amorphochlora_amoeboformis.AAC.1